MTKKTDNGNLGAKLDLRRHFLRRFHSDQAPDVLDCCQGDGVLWKTLQSEFKIKSYWGVDVKRKSGRLRIDSVKLCSQGQLVQNVVDIDTYGSPWKHWLELIGKISRPTTVLMTIGMVKVGGGNIQQVVLDCLGIPKEWRVPVSLRGQLDQIGSRYCLGQCRTYGWEILEAKEVVTTGNARYWGVHLIPEKREACHGRQDSHRLDGSHV